MKCFKQLLPNSYHSYLYRIKEIGDAKINKICHTQTGIISDIIFLWKPLEI